MILSTSIASAAPTSEWIKAEGVTILSLAKVKRGDDGEKLQFTLGDLGSAAPANSVLRPVPVDHIRNTLGMFKCVISSMISINREAYFVTAFIVDVIIYPNRVEILQYPNVYGKCFPDVDGEK